MKVLVCIDDTDNLESIGTGKLSQVMVDKIENLGWGNCSAISRHQLFVHDDIPYTSHNSAMCFSINYDRKLGHLKDFCADFLKTESAPGSDPGLCITNLGNGIDKKKLITFGYSAKHSVLSKSEAYDLATSTGVHLSEHGGTGDGVVGALAGIGLRLSGNDGRLRGWDKVKKNRITTVKRLCLEYKIDAVFTTDGTMLEPDVKIILEAEKIKTMLANNQRVIFVTHVKDDSDSLASLVWRTLNKNEIRQY